MHTPAKLLNTQTKWLGLLLMHAGMWAGFSIGNFPDFKSCQAQQNPGNTVESDAVNEQLANRQSRLWLTSADPRASRRWETPLDEAMLGVVIDINEQDIVYIPNGESTKTRTPSDRLEAIDVAWGTEQSSKAHHQFLEKEFSTFIAMAKTAIASGKVPRWQQRILAAEMAEAVALSGKWESAGKVFVSLVRENPPPLLYASAPIQWGQATPTSVPTATAKQWLDDANHPFSRLLGASWLVGSNLNSEAKSVLEQLVRDKIQPISDLASAQLWRIATPKEVGSNYKSWQAQRDKLLVALQAGPTIVLAKKLQSAGLLEQSQQEWLTIAIVTKPHTLLSNYAREQIVQSMTESNKPKSEIETVNKLFQLPGK